jgi:hypothetical protein
MRNLEYVTFVVRNSLGGGEINGKNFGTNGGDIMFGEDVDKFKGGIIDNRNTLSMDNEDGTIDTFEFSSFKKELNCKYCKQNPIEGFKCWNNYKEDNYSCQMLNRLRDLQYLEDERIVWKFHNDQNYLLIVDVDKILNYNAVSLYCSWYKHRGRVESLLLITDECESLIPNEEELTKIIEYYENIGKDYNYLDEVKKSSNSKHKDFNANKILYEK